MRTAIAAATLLLAACHTQQTRDEINGMEANGVLDEGKPAQRADPGSPAAPVSIDRKDELVDFHAAWPAEAAAIPALDARFRSEADKALAELVAGAKDDKAMREKDGIEFHGYSGTTDYKVAGASERLLSLDAVVEGYTGGAHGSHGTVAVLWDKALDKDIGFAGLFTNPSVANASIAKAWCEKLGEERAKKRGTQFRIEEADDPFNQCPALDEIHVIPVDKDGDHRFEALRVVADPYVAGPWAEGDYEAFLPVTAGMVGAFKPEYRASFKA